jgi:hypothetical protein
MAVDASASETAKPVGATRFFWVWLITATGVSVAGNVAHAVLTAPTDRVPLAAAAAVAASGVARFYTFGGAAGPSPPGGCAVLVRAGHDVLTSRVRLCVVV